ncbi:DUF2931 family protein [Pseudomonas sp. NPDC090208]|uniref:DUF2931 family protein n=1 Tax=Pseudomonas sp. NPDC090208 TaxID=3364478 RepID=UPI0037F83C23
MKARLWLFISLLYLCNAGAAEPSMPYPSWHLGFLAPDYMDVWLETADFTDINGDSYTGAMRGLVAIWQPEDGTGDPTRTLGKYLLGKGIQQFTELPKQLFVRWQSLAEPQTYRATIDIPASVRELMRKSERVNCAITGWADEYRDSLAVMLAPGGIVKVWVGSSCFPAIPIARIQGEVEPLGPYQGRSGGVYRPLEPAARAYVEKHGIPYGSW